MHLNGNFGNSLLAKTAAVAMGGTGSAVNPMRAVVRQSGLVFTAAYETPPAPIKGQVLVKIGAAAINPVDYKAPKLILGNVAGLDFSGTIEAIGEGVGEFKVGDVVYGTTLGSLADRALVDATSMSLAPKGLSMVEAAAMPVTYLTSYQALTKYGSLKKGGRVLVIGSSGGCGTAALQLARHMGASEVVGVCSSKNADYCIQHGATRVVDYTKQTITDAFANATDDQKFDVIYDCATNSGAGEDYKPSAIPLLCEGGGDSGRGPGQYVAINGAAGMWIRLATNGQKANEHLFLTLLIWSTSPRLWQQETGRREKVGRTEASDRSVIVCFHSLLMMSMRRSRSWRVGEPWER